MSLLPTVTVNLPFLAREVNDAHAQVQYHAKGMLLEAKRAGEALIEAKKLCRHGGFKAWVEANCRCSYRTARVYMQVANSKVADLCQFDSIAAFLEATAVKKAEKPQPSAPQFTRDDAEYVLKLHALAERGEGGEREVAVRKLNSFAQQFGMAGEEVVEKAKAMQPEAELTKDEATKQHLKAEILAPFKKMSKDELLEVVFSLILKMSRDN
jgi:hypothetical protein